MTKIKRYYYAEVTGVKLIVTLKELCLGFMPLIWNNAGLYGIISKEKVKNMIETLGIQEKAPTLNRGTMSLFYWDDVEIIDPKIGKMLSN